MVISGQLHNSTELLSLSTGLPSRWIMSPQRILTRKVKQMTFSGFSGKDSICFDRVKKCHINFSLFIQWESFTLLSSITESAVTEENTAEVIWRQEGESI